MTKTTKCHNCIGSGVVHPDFAPVKGEACPTCRGIGYLMLTSEGRIDQTAQYAEFTMVAARRGMSATERSEENAFRRAVGLPGL